MSEKNKFNIDYKKVGLKCGLEIHQQLNTKKLFCNCDSIVHDNKIKSDFSFTRKLKPAKGETGQIDAAAAFESKKDITTIYHGINDSCCLVELDEEPPHEMNKEALNVVMQFAKLSNTNIYSKFQVMRKTVIDGSNTSGFQRTTLIGENGTLHLSKQNVEIESVCIEEDSCRIEERTEKGTRYNLDRLGIPLIEIATAPQIHDPETAKECAKHIGMLLRSTRKVKRGLGTIRQDVNVSIKGGLRAELKGVQSLDGIPELIDYEILRQQNLLQIFKELKEKKAEVFDKIFDITKLFKKSESKVIQSAFQKKNPKVYAIKLIKFNGYIGKEIQPGRRLGTEYSDYGKKMGVKGLFHSDELPKYGITQEEVDLIKSELKIENDDAFILIADTKKTALKAITIVKDRASKLEMLKEVRNANEDGTSSFSRPMPGSSRMYPETDIPLIDCPDLNKIKLPELIPNTIKRFQNQYGLNQDLATIWAKETSFDLDKIMKENKTDAKIATRIFIEAPAQIKKMEKIEIIFTNNLIKELFEKLIPKNNSKQAIETALIDYMKKGKIDYEKFNTVDNLTVEKFVKKIISENPDKRPNVYMGLVMKEFQGKVDGKTAMMLINKYLN